MDFLEELKWRGMLKDSTGGVEKLFATGEMVTGYHGVDPTASSLHIGNLAAFMMLVHLQRAGHRPIALVGGATGMVGDPSGKNAERQLLSEEILNHNIACLKKEMSKLLDFDESKPNGAMLVNNYDWYKNMPTLTFLRDIGKHITISYMLAKESVQNRMETGISFTEFSYQLIQGYDFKYLHDTYGCKLQMGGSDQWGNITTGTEFIRRMGGGHAEAITCPLIMKADGSKFGKSEKGSIFLNADLTSPYEFYQYWINSSDTDAKQYIRKFTFLDRPTIEALEAEHEEAPHRRILQKRVAEEVTTMIHGKEEYEGAVRASQILFGKGTRDTLAAMSERQLLEVFDGVPIFKVAQAAIENEIGVLDLLAEKTTIFGSKGEVRRKIKEGGVSINKVKLTDIKQTVGCGDLLSDKYLIVQKGKKHYHLVVVE